jgi:hypothetical protein
MTGDISDYQLPIYQIQRYIIYAVLVVQMIHNVDVNFARCAFSFFVALFVFFSKRYMYLMYDYKVQKLEDFGVLALYQNDEKKAEAKKKIEEIVF